MKAKKFTFPRLSSAKKLYLIIGSDYKIQEATIEDMDTQKVWYSLKGQKYDPYRFYNKAGINSANGSIFSSKIKAQRAIIGFCQNHVTACERGIISYRNQIEKFTKIGKDAEKYLKRFKL